MIENIELPGTYNPWLVLLSVIVAMAASYTALDLAWRVTRKTGSARRNWLMSGALTIAAMHYTAMAAVIFEKTTAPFNPVGIVMPPVFLAGAVALGAFILLGFLDQRLVEEVERHRYASKLHAGFF